MDEFIFFNMVSNCVVLYITGYIAKLKTKSIRILLSAISGSVYAFFYKVYLIKDISFLVSVFMIFLAFGYVNFKRFIRGILFFYISAFSLGGAVYAVMNITNLLTYKVFFVVFLVTFIMIFLAEKLREKYNLKHDITYKMRVIIDDKEATFLALADTGNFLSEPFTNNAVAVVDRDKISKILPTTDKDTRLRFIPYKSVGKEGVLFGIKPDAIYIDDKKVDVTIAFSESEFGNGEYGAVFNPNRVEGGNFFEHNKKVCKKDNFTV